MCAQVCRENCGGLRAGAALLVALAALLDSAPHPTLAQSTKSSQEAVLAPNENLMVEGVPPIPQSLAQQADRYTNFRSAFFASWHPTKREMLISTRFADTFQIHQVKMPAGARTQLTFYADDVRSALYPPKGDDSFVFSKDIGGGEFYQLYRYDESTGTVTLLTDGKSRNTGEVWSNAGKQIAYSSTRRDGKDLDIWLSEPAHPEDPKTNRMLAQMAGGGWSALDWSPDDKQILILEEISANETYLWLMDSSTGEKTLLTPKGGAEKIAYASAKFSKDTKGIYLTTDKDSEFQRLAYLDLSSKKYTFLTEHIHWDVEDFDITPDGKTIAFTTNEDGFGVVHLLDTSSGKEKPAPKLPAGLLFSVKWHHNGRDLAFGLTGSRSATDVYSVDVTSGRVERWTESETGGLNPESFSAAELVHWNTFDGKSISGFPVSSSRAFHRQAPGDH